MTISEKILNLLHDLKTFSFTLVAVSKNHPAEAILDAYKGGQRHFGENKVQEMSDKQLNLPSDIKWHMIGHLQRNKVKYIAPYVHLIHSVDSLKLLKEINKEAKKNERTIDCLLQIHIAREESKFGMDWMELETLLQTEEFKTLENICIKGLMAMATNTDDISIVRAEFRQVKVHFDTYKNCFNHMPNVDFHEISMGMSGDYKVALEEGSTLIRIGSSIFGSRNY